MSITFLSNPIHLPDFFKFDREYLGKQESQNEDQKVFHKDTLEVSQLSKNRENLTQASQPIYRLFGESAIGSIKI